MINKIHYMPIKNPRSLNKKIFVKPAHKTQDSVSFTGLNNALSKKLYLTNEEIKDLIDKNPNAKGIVGNLPANWIQQIPKDKRGESIQEIYRSFGKMADLLRVKSKLYITHYNEIEEASSLLKTALQDKGVIATPQYKWFYNNPLIKKLAQLINKAPEQLKESQLEKVGAGNLANAFKFRIGNETFIMKVFYDYDKEIVELTDKKGHFKYIEPNRAAFIKKNVKRHEYADFYFADLNKGYMITKFIDETSSEPTHKLNGKSIGVKHTDIKDLNIVNDHIIDYGGLKIESTILAQNKTARWVFNQITRLPEDQWQEKWADLQNQASKNIIPNASDVLIGLKEFQNITPELKF